MGCSEEAPKAFGDYQNNSQILYSDPADGSCDISELLAIQTDDYKAVNKKFFLLFYYS